MLAQTTNGRESILDRGVRLARMLAEATDKPQAVLAAELPAPCQCVDCVNRAADPCAAAEQEDAGDPSTWPEWTDEGYWAPGAEPDLDAPQGPTPEEEAEAADVLDGLSARRFLDRYPELPLAEAVDRVTDHFRGYRTPFGDLLARVMDAAALKVRLSGAVTPAEWFEREAEADDDARRTWEEVGFARGLAVARAKQDAALAAEVANRRGKPSPSPAGGDGIARAFCY